MGGWARRSGVALTLLGLVVAVGFFVALRGPAGTADRCWEPWRSENAQDCEVRVALETWKSDPEAGRRAIEAISDPLARDYAWLELVKTQEPCRVWCEQIATTGLRAACEDKVSRPWTYSAESRDLCPAEEWGRAGREPWRAKVGEAPQIRRTEVDESPPVLASPLGGELTRSPSVPVGSATGGAADAKAVVEGVRSSKGRVESCVQAALLLDPALSGRIAIGWEITAGRVRYTRLVADTTGSEPLTSCVQKAVRSMRFPDDLTVVVDEYAWTVSGVD